MTIVLTMTVAGEVELVDAQIAFHLHAGVDRVVVGAGRNVLDPPLARVLDRYERAGLARMVDVEAATEEELRTILMRKAVTDFDADWVLDVRPGEFWWPRGESIGGVAASVPLRYSAVQGLVREFQDAAGAAPVWERAVVRTSLLDPVASSHAGVHLLRPMYRAVPELRSASERPLEGRVLRSWYPFEVFALPLSAPPATADGIERGLASGALVRDERLRRMLERLREGSSFELSEGSARESFPVPTIAEDAEYGIECAAVREVDLDDLERKIAELEGRIATVEQGFWLRVLRAASRIVRREHQTPG